MTGRDVVDFWLAAGSGKWFSKDDGFDDLIRERFGDAVEAAARGEYAGWSATPEGALGLVILLDQFPRNLHRTSGEAFRYDPLARGVASVAIDARHDMALPQDQRIWFYMPFMHSEDIADQERCVTLLRERAPEAEETLRFAEIHKDIIVRFGRFPHRNAVLGRPSSAEEKIYLSSDDAFSG